MALFSADERLAFNLSAIVFAISSSTSNTSVQIAIISLRPLMPIATRID